MRKNLSVPILSFLFSAGLCFNCTAQSVGINTDGSTANASAMLDIKNPNKGLLIPRVALSGTGDAVTIAAPAVSLLVYNTAAAGAGGTAVVPGFYYWSGSAWIMLNTGAGGSSLPAGTAAGQMLVWNGTAWVTIPAGLPGQYLQAGQSGVPGWTGVLFATLSTTAVTPDIYYYNASAGGNIITDGGAAVTARGIVWNTATGPTTANSKTTDGAGLGSFSSQMTGLSPATPYYFRAYAVNAVGTSYGNESTFTTAANTPATVSTTAISNITGGTASSGVTVSAEGNSHVTARGVCWSTATNPTVADNKTINAFSGTVGTVINTLSGMTVSTTYYVRAYATNSAGTAYGNQFSFTTTSSFGVGVAYQGGIVGYIFQPGDMRYVAGQTHGMIVTASDQTALNADVAWTVDPIYVSTATDTTFGTATVLGAGNSNTVIISGQINNSNLAATICRNLVSGGYSDWFLPSKDELTKIYLNKESIGGFLSIVYWSSSGNAPAYTTTTIAYYLPFNGPLAFNPASAQWLSGSGTAAVRAVRYF